MMFPKRARRRRISPVVTCMFTAALGACAAPPPQPMTAVTLTDAVEARTSPVVLREALAVHPPPALGLDWPELQTLPGDPGGDGYWHAHAAAWNPDVRVLVRQWRARGHQVDGAGWPDRTAVGYGIEDLAEPDRQHELRGTIDLLGVLGLGRKPAERNAAERREELALSRVEQAVWKALFDVDRARVSYSAARRRDQRLAELVGETHEGLRRLSLLDERGRLGDGLLARAQAVVAALESRLNRTMAETAVARRTLASTSGLPWAAPSLDAALDLTGRADRIRPRPAPATEALLGTVPSLRTGMNRYAVTEAELRVASSSWWPGIRIGPGLKIRPDELLTGGAIALDLPWPAVVEAEIGAAVERRSGAREAVEDDLLATLHTIAERRRAVQLAMDQRTGNVAALRDGSQKAWRAARARLSVLEGIGPVETWLDAMELRTRGLLEEIDADERLMIVDLDFREAAGLPPGLDREDAR